MNRLLTMKKIPGLRYDAREDGNNFCMLVTISWSATVRERLVCLRRCESHMIWYAMAIKKSTPITGHLP